MVEGLGNSDATACSPGGTQAPACAWPTQPAVAAALFCFLELCKNREPELTGASWSISPQSQSFRRPVNPLHRCCCHEKHGESACACGRAPARALGCWRRTRLPWAGQPSGPTSVAAVPAHIAVMCGSSSYQVGSAAFHWAYGPGQIARPCCCLWRAPVSYELCARNEQVFHRHSWAEHGGLQPDPP